MTRINLVPVEELTDQHLFAEFREIKMVPKSLRRSLEAMTKRQMKHHLEYVQAWNKSLELVLKKVPKQFTLNTGHVSFFYDKGEYLHKRYLELRRELTARNINFNRAALLDDAGVFFNLDERFNTDYAPTPEALEIIRTRIAEKIAMKPAWYKKHGKSLMESKNVQTI